MENCLVSGTLNEKIKWYIRAHGHSSIGSLNLIWTYFKYSGNPELTNLVEECIRNFEDFAKTDNLEEHHKVLDNNVKDLEKTCRNLQIDPLKKQEIVDLIDSVWVNIHRIDKILKSPGYEEVFLVSDILHSTLSEIIERYPNILFGDFIGIKGKDIGDKVNLHISISDEPSIRICGYEMQLLFFNMISNSIDSVLEKDKGEIWLDITISGDDLIIEISDSGKLLTAEEIVKINTRELFSTKGKTHGSGMKIIYDIVDKYGAKIEVKTDNKKTFIITFPLRK